MDMNGFNKNLNTLKKKSNMADKSSVTEI